MESESQRCETWSRHHWWIRLKQCWRRPSIQPFQVFRLIREAHHIASHLDSHRRRLISPHVPMPRVSNSCRLCRFLPGALDYILNHITSRGSSKDVRKRKILLEEEFVFRSSIAQLLPYLNDGGRKKEGERLDRIRDWLVSFIWL